MLADNLLANMDYNTDKELHTLELLKLRFGEMSMRQCEVMIKDIDNSKRTVTSIHSMIQANEGNEETRRYRVAHFLARAPKGTTQTPSSHPVGTGSV
jgi:anaphase-promoting complex subunit 2